MRLSVFLISVRASYSLNNHLLVSTKSVVYYYLGIFINSHLKWSDHVKHTTAKVVRSLNILQHSLTHVHLLLKLLPISVLSAPYWSMVRPILEYGPPHTGVWSAPYWSILLQCACGTCTHLVTSKCVGCQMGLWKSMESCLQTNFKVI